RLDGLQFVLGQVGAAQDVGVDLQGSGQVARDGSAPEAHVHGADAFAAVQAEVVEVTVELAAIALAGAAGNQVGQHAGHAEASGRVVGAPGGDEEVEGGGADVFHAFRQQGEPVGEGVLKDLWRHGHLDTRANRLWTGGPSPLPPT